ncbi:MAG: hypothetical protein H6628_21070 [Calditrichae bacterium]|nr:hypothetical protein [Calditrichia bacterium]
MEPFPTTIEFRRERDFGQVLSATFFFFRQNVKPLSKHLLLIIGPLLIIWAIYNVYNLRALGEDYPTGLFETMMLLTSNFSLMSFLPMLIGLVYIALIYGYMTLYMDRGFAQFGTGDILRLVLRHFLRLAVASALMFMMLTVGVFFFLVPFVYLLVVLSNYYIIMLREDAGIFDAIVRCFQLIAGKWWPTFGLLLILWIIYFAFSFAVSLPVLALTFLVNYNSASDVTPTNLSMVWIFLNPLLSYISYLLTSIPVMAVAFHYFSLVEQKEKTGLLERIAAIDPGASEAQRAEG